MLTDAGSILDVSAVAMRPALTGAEKCADEIRAMKESNE